MSESRIHTARSPYDVMVIGLFVLLNLHLLRNLSVVYLAAPIALTVLLVILAVRARLALTSSIARFYFAFVWWTIYVVLISPFSIRAGEIAIAAPRMFFVLPIAFIVSEYVSSDKLVRQILLAFAIFAAIGSLTVPLQFLIGPIGWFADASSRSGFDRFASLFGNLTAVGIVGGIGLIVALLLDMNAFVRGVLIGAILSGMLLSLQKAAIMNIFLVAAAYSWFSKPSLFERGKRLAYICIAGAIIVGVLYLAFGSVALAALDNVFRWGDQTGYDDYTVGASIGQRLWELPGIVFSEYGMMGVLLGVGLKGGGGAFGLPEAPQAHNAFFDLVFLGGIIYLVIFVALLWHCFGRLSEISKLAANSKDSLRINNVSTLTGACVLFTANLPFASGVIFQPNEAILFWLTVGLLSGIYGTKAVEVRRGFIPAPAQLR